MNITENTTPDDGGQAFPHSSQPLDGQGNPLCGEHSEWGMSLRDWFAGQALLGILSNPQFIKAGKAVSSLAYSYADAMIDARKDTQTSQVAQK